jgi:predicted nuclease of restriction endonuclease-like (RecB) superfamily
VVSPLVTQLPWTHHLIILSEAKPVETREFYLLAAIKERWSKRELERQIRSGAVLRSTDVPKKVSPVVTQVHPAAIDEFKNAYNPTPNRGRRVKRAR